MKSSHELRRNAWEQLKLSYWMVFTVCLIVTFVPAGSAIGIIGFIIYGPLLVGMAYYLLDMIESKNDGKKIELILEGFKQSFATSFLAMIFRGFFIMLWSLLLIIPGIVKALAYAMVPYIIAENPEINAMEALEKSEEMMKGHKTELFSLYLSFFGWYILVILTAGIGMFFLLPYIQTSVANFYIELRGKKKVILFD